MPLLQHSSSTTQSQSSIAQKVLKQAMSNVRDKKQGSNFEYLMNLFDKYDSSKNSKQQFLPKKEEEAKKEEKEREHSSSSSAAEYLSHIMQKRNDSSQEEDSKQMKSSMWIKQQQNELNSMREKYMNMSCMDVQNLTPVDMLNITFEHNKRKANIINSHHTSKRDIIVSSSSSSAKNNAGFNILEEMSKGARTLPKHGSKKGSQGAESPKSESDLSLSLLKRNIQTLNESEGKKLRENTESSQSNLSQNVHYESQFLKFLDNNRGRQGPHDEKSELSRSRSESHYVDNYQHIKQLIDCLSHSNSSKSENRKSLKNSGDTDKLRALPVEENKYPLDHANLEKTVEVSLAEVNKIRQFNVPQNSESFDHQNPEESSKNETLNFNLFKQAIGKIPDANSISYI